MASIPGLTLTVKAAARHEPERTYRTIGAFLE
jgi:hypothetical protein